MTHYLIEYRFQGKAKSEIKQMIIELDKKFHLGFIESRKPIPHISLAGPLTTNNESKLVKDFTSLCKSTPFCSFQVNGFDFFKDSRVIFINIEPSEKLDDFRWKLAQKIKPYCQLKDFDYLKKFEYHATLAFKLTIPQFKTIKNYIEKQNPPKYKQFLIRATIIKNSKILYEYDFLQRRLLTREEALSRSQLAKTMKLLNDFFEGKYDPNHNVNEKKSDAGSEKKPRPKKTPKLKTGGIIDKIKKVLNDFIG